MGIRRRRKTLTNLLSTLERRVTTVELRPINLLTAAEIAAANPGEETLDGGPNAIVAANAPNQYKPVREGYYYSSNLTGTKGKVELYFEADPGLKKDETIRVSGIRKLVSNNAPVDFNVSKDYKTTEVDTPPWEDRATYSGKRGTPGENIDSTAVFEPGIGTQYGSGRSLVVRRRIASIQANTTTATINFTVPNYYAVDDVVFVDLADEPAFYGIDGLYRVKEAGVNFITYDFDSPLPEPINLTTIAEERYVYAVAQSAIRDGATWIDTSSTPDTVYVWKDIRWVLLNSTTVEDDNINPGPVTNLEATSEDETPPGSANPSSAITLTWDAPTVNEDGTPLDDLIGYSIAYRQFQSQPWRDAGDITGAETTWTGGGFLQGTTAYLRVRSRDSGGNVSPWTEVSHTTGVATPQVTKPKAPAVSTYLGTIKVAYDDLTATGLVQASSAKEIEVFFSDVDNFTPGPSNFYGTFPANAGSYIIIPGTELVDNTLYYIKIRVRDIFGNITEPSKQVTVRAKLTDIVTYDMIDVGTLTGQVIIGLDIRTSSNPSTQGGVVINQQGIVAYSPPAGGSPAAQTFRINALTGSVSIGSYLGKDEAAGIYLGKLDAEKSYATIGTVDGISVIAGDAKTIAQAAQSGVSSVSSNLSAITTISAGVVTIRKNKVVGAINSGISSTNTTTIEGGSIRTGSLNADRIGAGTIDASKITVTNLNASNISSGTLTGRTIRTTSSSLSRVTMDAATNSIIFNSLSGALAGTLTGTTFPYNSLIISGGGGGSINVGNGRLLLVGKTQAGGSIDIKSTQIVFEAAGSTPDYLFKGSTSTVRIEDLSGSTSASVTASSFGTLVRGSSDRRLKNNISEAVPGLDFLVDLRPVSFTWKPDTQMGSGTNYGLIAQDVVEVLDKHGITDQNLVYKHNTTSKVYEKYIPEGDTPYGFEYTPLIPVLIKGIQELSSKIDSLEARLDQKSEGL